jgi:SAM-dependent methyltransferase
MQRRWYVPAVLVATLGLSAAVLAAQNAAKPHAVSPGEIHNFKPQTVPLASIETEDLILDIGGSEGVIGHLMGAQVVTIDVDEKGLSKRSTESLKIVMDARELTFVDGSFSTVTSFFSLLRFDASDQVRVVEEVYRVLEPGGRFHVWDAVFGPRPEGKTIAMIPVAIRIKGEDIDAGYSRRWPAEVRDLDHYRKLAEAAGFVVLDVDEKASWFRFEFQKPGPE